jgi:hypothetical protein
MGVAAAFIDGGYLDKILLNDNKGKRIDYQKKYTSADSHCVARTIRPSDRSEQRAVRGVRRTP